MQKRSRSKSYNPGFYDLSTGGYLNIDDLDDENDMTNAKREETEELGIQFKNSEGSDDIPLKYLNTIKFSDEKKN